MKLRALIIAVAIGLYASYASRGEVIAWQVAEPLSSNSFIQTQGTAAQSLFLSCDSTVGECKWRITTRVWIMDGTLASYSLWIRDPAGAATQLSLSETSVIGSPFTNHVLPPVENRPDGVLSSLIVGLPQGGSPIPAGPTIYNLHSYVLTTQAGIAPGTLTQLRAGSEGFGGFEPGVQPPFNTRRVVAFGANPGFQIAGGEWPNPVIHINYVPEPTTAALLLAPAVLLLSRRGPRGRFHWRDQRRRD